MGGGNELMCRQQSGLGIGDQIFYKDNFIQQLPNNLYTKMGEKFREEFRKQIINNKYTFPANFFFCKELSGLNQLYFKS